MKLKTYSFFHLNLAYSAIEEAQRKEVIDRCYWPLLRLARNMQLPFGIEASAWTLETIANIDAHWLDELRDLVTNGPCEFIGSGYTQIIGPLVPADVNAANLRIGMQRYQALLGLNPKIALVNEQAYSAGLVMLYREAGYEALLMEWNNPARSHPEWDAECRYLPQYVCGPAGAELPLIWNNSVSFQKVQRYVHGDIELDEYISYLQSQIGTTTRAFPIYGNDVEVFDFRPRRYTTEAPLHAFGEWQRIQTMFTEIQKNPSIEMIAPSAVLQMMGYLGAGNRLHLEAAACPVPVKKQDKYNLLRWAVTGRDDLGINSLCWRIYQDMRASSVATDSDWAELCYLWSSDFRTHITEKRWVDFSARLTHQADRWRAVAPQMPVMKAGFTPPRSIGNASIVTRKGRFLDIEGKRFKIRLNCFRGLALESLVDRAVGEQVLCGTLHHGYFDDIGWANDYYSGHLVFESPGISKVTDLNMVEPKVERRHNSLLIKGEINTALGAVEKQWQIDQEKGRVTLKYRLRWPNLRSGSLRLGYLTLNPRAFATDTLCYQTHNGGRYLESFSMEQSQFDHGAPVSLMVSSNQALGLTEGKLLIGDANSVIEIQTDRSRHAAVSLISHFRIQRSHLTRSAFTVREIDDTSRGQHDLELDFEISLNAHRTMVSDVR